MARNLGDGPAFGARPATRRNRQRAAPDTLSCPRSSLSPSRPPCADPESRSPSPALLAFVAASAWRAARHVADGRERRNARRAARDSALPIRVGDVLGSGRLADVRPPSAKLGGWSLMAPRQRVRPVRRSGLVSRRPSGWADRLGNADGASPDRRRVVSCQRDDEPSAACRRRARISGVASNGRIVRGCAAGESTASARSASPSWPRRSTVRWRATWQHRSTSRRRRTCAWSGGVHASAVRGERSLRADRPPLAGRDARERRCRDAGRLHVAASSSRGRRSTGASRTTTVSTSTTTGREARLVLRARDRRRERERHALGVGRVHLSRTIASTIRLGCSDTARRCSRSSDRGDGNTCGPTA